MGPLAEKYPMFTPYTYTANNPIRFIDPNGEDFIIHYGDNKQFVFNGKNYKEAPNDRFVQSFLSAYKSNVKNGGAENSLKIATDSKYRIGVNERKDEGGSFSPAKKSISWNPNLAMETDQGVVLSPASIFEHEADHAKAYNDDKEGYNKRVGTLDAEYKNLEERRVVLGSEQRVALANGEIQQGQITRSFYGGSAMRYFETISPTSTIPRFDFKRSLNEAVYYKILGGSNTVSPFRYPQLYYRIKK